MLCCICKEREATVHYTKIDGDKVQKVDLCEECSKTKGVNDPVGFELADLLLGLGASKEIEQSSGGAEIKCTRCGFTQADFKKAGRLGCPECYKTFAEGLDGLLKTMHKGTRHMGKVPEALRQSRELADRLKLLQKKLTKAVEDENFEQAASLRDEIKQMSVRLSNISVG
ncbi:MAG TPA: UvrB/UvrC motif-containing protein [Verrucomicrobiae bacterium]|jgi:protein arginine kinase activator|nr:UvrB/UvrC motif-containing protein [Verrucomicrobiae bacterium]